MINSFFLLAAAETPATNPANDPTSPMFWTTNALWLTLGLIFVSSFLAIIFKGFSVDRCFKKGKKKGALAILDGKGFYGELKPYSGGLLLKRFNGNRTIIFRGEYDKLYSLLWRSSGSGGVIYKGWKKVSRKFRSIFAIFRDAVTQGIGAVIGQAKALSAKKAVMKTHGDKLSSLGSGLVTGTVTQEYEPILERYIGRVFQFDWQSARLKGTLLEYSGQYIVFDMVEIEITFGWEINQGLEFSEGPVGLWMKRGEFQVVCGNNGDKNLVVTIEGNRQILRPTPVFPPPDETVVTFPCLKPGASIEMKIEGVFTLVLPRSQVVPREVLGKESLFS